MDIKKISIEEANERLQASAEVIEGEKKAVFECILCENYLKAEGDEEGECCGIVYEIDFEYEEITIQSTDDDVQEAFDEFYCYDEDDNIEKVIFDEKEAHEKLFMSSMFDVEQDELDFTCPYCEEEHNWGASETEKPVCECGAEFDLSDFYKPRVIKPPFGDVEPWEVAGISPNQLRLL